ncbi:MAG TPA: nuclear transport factor 2 family protein [Candidatus Dormibacteraeota bacterium]|nr:nuclear transport factor 2 family protein [Candidatus Dormibacteraeota bacterium]
MRQHFSRRKFLTMGTAALVALPAFDVLSARAGEFPGSQVSGPESVQVALIYELQAAFHRAKTTQDLDLMMSLWADDGVLTVQGNPNSPFVGTDHLRGFWAGSGSFTHHRFSLVPSFKTQIRVEGDAAWLYFECHDVANFDQTTRAIVNDTFLAGTLQKNGAIWQFKDMTAGPSSPLSVDHYYFP